LKSHYAPTTERAQVVAATVPGVLVPGTVTLNRAAIGMTGALYASSSGYISPDTYGFGNVDVRVLVLVAFGGLGTLLGPLVSAGVFAILDEQLSTSLELREVLYGVFVIAIFLFFGRGLVGAVAGLSSRLAGAARKPAPQASGD